MGRGLPLTVLYPLVTSSATFGDQRQSSVKSPNALSTHQSPSRLRQCSNRKPGEHLEFILQKIEFRRRQEYDVSE